MTKTEKEEITIKHTGNTRSYRDAQGNEVLDLMETGRNNPVFLKGKTKPECDLSAEKFAELTANITPKELTWRHEKPGDHTSPYIATAYTDKGYIAGICKR